MRLIILPLILLSAFLFAEESHQQPTVLVSVAPYRFFVNQIAQDVINVKLMVPAGASAHTYEPTPKEMIQSTHADIWFQLGEPFEARAIKALLSVNPSMQVVDLQEGISLIHGACKYAHAKGGCGNDLHLWLSPKIVKKQSETITHALVLRYPEYAKFFNTNLQSFLKALDALDTHIQSLLRPVKNRTLLVSHPAYAYFCKEYQFHQLPIEFEGKDPTSKQLTKLLYEAKTSQVHAIFTQPQYSDKAARLIANEIHAKVIEIDPYAEDYITTMRMIAKLIAENS